MTNQSGIERFVAGDNQSRGIAVAELLIPDITAEFSSVARMNLRQLSGFLETVERNPDMIPRYIDAAKAFISDPLNSTYRAVIRATISHFEEYQRTHYTN